MSVRWYEAKEKVTIGTGIYSPGDRFKIHVLHGQRLVRSGAAVRVDGPTGTAAPVSTLPELEPEPEPAKKRRRRKKKDTEPSAEE